MRSIDIGTLHAARRTDDVAIENGAFSPTVAEGAAESPSPAYIVTFYLCINFRNLTVRSTLIP